MTDKSILVTQLQQSHSTESVNPDIERLQSTQAFRLQEKGQQEQNNTIVHDNTSYKKQKIDGRRNELKEKNQIRLKKYEGRMILFPVNKKKPKPGDSSQKECDTALQLKRKRLLPLATQKKKHEKSRKVSSESMRLECSDRLGWKRKM
ncbi:Ribosomal protein L13 [Oopsacas minuta]|uniref:Large ribosomal subunit protein eL13 n=1 Tax=Oopsacas minuta TaxID=111878 RepID=A0AAV7KDA1_9METZ|nr:Ribosomal protein L13 [Oopsacas minuta]